MRASCTNASRVPDASAVATPHTTKPRAKTPVVGTSTQPANVTAARTPDSASIRRRDVASAQAPEGTSRTIDVTDHSTNSAEIDASESPWEAKSSG